MFFFDLRGGDGSVAVRRGNESDEEEERPPPRRFTEAPSSVSRCALTAPPSFPRMEPFNVKAMVECSVRCFVGLCFCYDGKVRIIELQELLPVLTWIGTSIVQQATDQLNLEIYFFCRLRCS